MKWDHYDYYNETHHLLEKGVASEHSLSSVCGRNDWKVGWILGKQQCLLLVVRLKLVLTPYITWKEMIFLSDKKEKDESHGRSEAELDIWTEYFLLLTALFCPLSHLIIIMTL